jgi:hypothetical protein
MRDSFWNLVCDFQHVIYVMIVLDVILLALLVLALPFIEWGTGASVIAVLNFFILFPMLLVMTFFFKKCGDYNSV